MFPKFPSDFKQAGAAKLSVEPIKVPEGADSSKYVVYVPCFPFFDILTAVGNPNIDYFSLDIEGLEMKVAMMHNNICL